MRRQLASLALIAALGGCSTMTDVKHPFGSTARWGADRQANGEPRLWFGVPDSDDVDVLFTCLPHAKRVETYAALPVERPMLMITFASGAAVSRHFMKRLDSDDGYGGFIAADDPALVAFAQTGKLAIAGGGKRVRYPPANDMAEAFLKVCR